MKWTMTTRPMMMEQSDQAHSLVFSSCAHETRTLEFYFNHTPISTQQALEWGLVNRIFATPIS